MQENCFHSLLRLFLIVLQHMRSPSVSCLDVDTSLPSSDSTPATLTPSTPTKSHRRSASCGNNPASNIQSSGSDMHIIRIRMDLQDGNLYRSILVRIPGHRVCCVITISDDPTSDLSRSQVQIKQLLFFFPPASGNQ